MKRPSTHLALFMAIALPLHAASPTGKTQRLTSPAEVPEGLAKSDWASIREAYEAGRHQISAVTGGHQARNPGQQWTTTFDGRGFLTQPDAGGWQWGFELQSYGFEGDEHALAAKPSVRAVGSRMEYGWDAALQEWFINDHRGLEHGFTVRARPGGISDFKSQISNRLAFTLAVRGTLRPVINADAQGVQFQNESGTTVVNYAGLKVWDADGRILPSHFAAGDTQSTVRLLVDESSARYPITVDPIAQQAFLKASNTGAGDQFGYSVAISGETMVVGAPYEDGSGAGIDPVNDDALSTAGAAYVYLRSAGVWTLQATLKASNPGLGDSFGDSVAVSGDTVIVGAPFEDGDADGVNLPSDELATNAGAAYIFVRTGVTWAQQAYVKASNSSFNDWFGKSVSVSGDTVAVGASTQTGTVSQSGAVYAFVRIGTVWSEQAYLKASNAESYDYFGDAVAVSGDTIVVGATHEDENINGIESGLGVVDSGAAYVFFRTGTSWSQQGYLKAAPYTADNFGSSVAIDGDTVVVGARLGGPSNDGGAHVFVRSAGVWSLQESLESLNLDHDDWFGTSVGVSGDTIVVGAELEQGSGVGVDPLSDELANSAGAAYVFIRNGVTWTQQSYLKASNTGGDDRFGYAAAISGGTVVIGGKKEDSGTLGVNPASDEAALDAGAAYVFTGAGPTTQEIAVELAALVIADGGSADFGGVSVGSTADLVFTVKNTGTNALVLNGNPLVQITGADAAMFTVITQPISPVTGPSGTTTFTLRFAPTSSGAKSAAISIVSNDIDEAVFGINLTGTALAPEIAVEQAAVSIADGGGKAFGGTLVGGTTELTFTIKNIGTADLTLSGLPKVAVSGADAAMFTVITQPISPVSSPSGSTTFTVRFAPTSVGVKTAALSIANNDADENPFEINLIGNALPTGISPAQQAYVKGSSAGIANSFIGQSVAVSGDTAVVGSREDGADVFVRNGAGWTFQAHLTGLNTESDDNFGSSVAISGDTIVIGAQLEDGGGTGVNPADNNLGFWSGAAYVFVRNGAVWSQQAYLKASNAESDDRFGWSVAVSGDTVVVGALYEDGSGTGVNPPDDNGSSGAGAAYVFERSGAVWSQQAFLKASNTDVGDYFGGEVAVSGDTIVVGAYSEDGSGTGVNPASDNLAVDAGAAYVFVRSGAVWSQEAYLKASNTDGGDAFGTAVSVAADTVVVGSWFEAGGGIGVNSASDELATAAGAAYVFVRSGAVWSQQAYLKASNTGSSDYFGYSVAVSGDIMVIGAKDENGSGTGVNPLSDELAIDAGAAYVFVRSGLAWSQQAYLKASNTGSDDAFGSAVAISGGTVVIGAPYEDGGGTGVNPASDELGDDAGAAYFFAGFGLPEIAVAQSAVNIADGGSKAFGTVTMGSTADLTFTIKNTGIADLHVDPITFSGTDAAMFSVTDQPASTVSAVTGSTTFTVRFAPTSAGLKTATLSIANNDADENPFEITIFGTGESGDIASSFSTLSNPNGAWTYGYTTTLGSAFTAHVNQGVYGGLDEWHTNAVGAQPWVAHNGTGAVINVSTISVELGALSLHPGGAGQLSVVRYTASAAGFYKVAGSFFSQDIFGTPKDVHVLRNGVAVFDGAVNGYGPASAVPYDVVVQLVAGDTVDFAVGIGTDFNSAFDSTGLAGTIMPFTGAEITLLGNGVSITDGDITPRPDDHTDFGSVLPASGSIVRTFTITNTGPNNLTLGAITISGANAANFTLTTAPISPVTSGNSTTFQITFDPSAVGAHTATVSFNNNDVDETAFDFSIYGRGTGPGDLDLPFNGGTDSVVYGMATQPDGKTIIVGNFTAVQGVARNYIARLNADGSLDTAFNPRPNAYSLVDCVALQPDGKILIGGIFTSLQPPGEVVPVPRNRIARLNADGSLDRTFDPNANGYVVNSIVVQPNGKILLGGSFTTLQPPGEIVPVTRNRIARLNEDGSLDAEFDPNANGQVIGMAVQPDGKILLGGNFNTLQPTIAGVPTALTAHSGIARIHANGSIDSTFDTQANDAVYDVVVQADGKILLAGEFDALDPTGVVGYTSRAFIARVNDDGTLDTGFDPKANNVVNSIALQTDGKVVFGGLFNTLQPSGGSVIPRNFIARMNADGSLDSNFDPNANHHVYGVALQADGAVLMGGLFTTLQPNGTLTPITRVGMARLLNDPAPQTLSVASPTRIEWLRGGSSPETQRVTFELSTDGGLNYTGLGIGTRIIGGWELTGLSLPATGQIRARTRNIGGAYCGSSGIVESVIPLSGPPAPEITVRGNGSIIANGDLTPNPADLTDFGFAGAAAGTGLRTFVIQNTGTATLNLSTITISGANAADFTISAAPAATVAASANTQFTIAFNPSAGGLRNATLNFTTDDSDETAFTFAIRGGGPNSPITNLHLSPFTLPEHNLPNTPVGGFVATDADAAAAHTFSFVNGAGDTDNASFSISGSVLTLSPSADFETKTSYAIRVEADDGNGGTFQKALTVVITNLNDVPSFLKGADINHASGTTAPQSIPGWATAITDGDAVISQALNFSNYFQSGSQIFQTVSLTSDGTLNYTLNGTPGSATFTVFLTDDTSVNGTPALSTASQTFTITTAAAADLDNDSLLDAWEIIHFGTIAAHTATDDTDSDGNIELIEQAFALNPHLSDVPPAASLVGGYLTITITKQPGVTYEVQTAADLSAFSASTTTVLINDATTLQVRDNFLSSAAAARFMRVLVVGAP